MDELEILKIAHETDPSFTARTYYADILKFAKAIAAAEREAAMTAILDGCPNDGSETEIILRRAWDRVRTMRSNIKLSAGERREEKP